MKELLSIRKDSLDWVLRGVLRIEKKIQNQPFKNDMYLVIGEIYSAIEDSGVFTLTPDIPLHEGEALLSERLHILLKIGRSFLRFYPTQNHDYRQRMLTRAAQSFEKALMLNVCQLSCCI